MDDGPRAVPAFDEEVVGECMGIGLVSIETIDHAILRGDEETEDTPNARLRLANDGKGRGAVEVTSITDDTMGCGRRIRKGQSLAFRWIRWVALPLLVACVEPAAPTRFLVLGNSITHHPPATALGWTGDWGMAATDSSQDFAHRLNGVLLAALNISSLEQSGTFDFSRIDTLLHQRPDVIVVELGDNITDLASVTPAYRALVDSAARYAGILVCTTTWWPKPAISAMIRENCEAVGGRVVDLMGLIDNPANTGAADYPDAIPGVRSHPGNLGMKAIADAIQALVQ